MNPLIILLFMVLLVSSLAIFFFEDLLYVVIIFGAYSLVMALIWQQLNAPDIAITEAAVGIGMTVIMITVVTKVGRKPHEKTAALFCLRPGLCFGRLASAHVHAGDSGDACGQLGNPTHNQVFDRYVWEGPGSGGLNMVTNIILDYRGYDTLLETTVLFTAVMAIC